MKNCRLFLVAFVFISMSVFADGYQLSFTASGAGTTVDQVEVQNLATGTKITLSGSDVLQLGGTVNSVKSINADNGLELKIRYNSNLTGLSAELILENAEKVNMTVFDLAGREITRNEFNLTPGSHSFDMKGFKQGAYLLSVSTSKSNQIAKFIANSVDQTPSVSLVSTYERSQKAPIFKSKSAVILLEDYWEGDRILLKATSGNHKRIVVVQPDKNMTVDFKFIECVDNEGNHYAVTQIGSLYWMAESLKTTKYNNGDAIGTTATPNLDISAEPAPKYQWAYDGNEANVQIYGRLYTWYVPDDARGVNPLGWYVPSDLEWTEMNNLLGGSGVAGIALKDVGTTLWNAPNFATNETGFCGLPGGRRTPDGIFDRINEYGWFLESTGNTSNPANQRGRRLSFDLDAVGRYNVSKIQAGYIRCVKIVE